LVKTGRIYAEVRGPVNTGLAITNPNDQEASISFKFVDEEGRVVGTDLLKIPPNGQIARFLTEAPFLRTGIIGTLTFSSDLPVAVLALRGLTNERAEFLMTTTPIANLDTPP